MIHWVVLRFVSCNCWFPILNLNCTLLLRACLCTFQLRKRKESRRKLAAVSWWFCVVVWAMLIGVAKRWQVQVLYSYADLCLGMTRLCSNWGMPNLWLKVFLHPFSRVECFWLCISPKTSICLRSHPFLQVNALFSENYTAVHVCMHLSVCVLWMQI